MKEPKPPNDYSELHENMRQPSYHSIESKKNENILEAIKDCKKHLTARLHGNNALYHALHRLFKVAGIED